MGFFGSSDDEREEGTTPSGAPAETTEIVELYIDSINNITRKTDITGQIDPYVIVYANDVLVGKTKPVNNTTSVVVNELLVFKTKGEPKATKLRFELMDKDDVGDDDEVGSGSFNPAVEESLENQLVHLKYKGKDIGSISITMNIKPILLV